MARKTTLLSRWYRSGTPWVWLNAAAVAISLVAVLGLLALIASRGLAQFWPADVAELTVRAATGEQRLLGQFVRSERLSAQRYEESTGLPTPGNADSVLRHLVRTGNRRVNPPDFRWLYDHDLAAVSYPADAVVFERSEWGLAYGRLRAAGSGSSDDADAWTSFQQRLDDVRELGRQIDTLQHSTIRVINLELDALRLERRRLELDRNLEAPARAARSSAMAEENRRLQSAYELAEQDLLTLLARQQREEIVVELADGSSLRLALSDIVRAWRPNAMDIADKVSHYLDSVGRFLSEPPREANTEGGIFPAIFGTVLMVLLMSVVVTPLGVLAAIYLREYAKQGVAVRVIRIAVNNLAGVPSIVYGVFGLGFFVYVLGGQIDQLFFEATLPTPTFGSPGLLWASLTLALLTLPVVVVATEEGLARIPQTLREGSLALGATQAETLFRVMLPIAAPSILTGVILAIARAAGEVAPLMLVGVVKLAPALPIDGTFPFLHLERQFMHLGFHIYDVGFQSPNVEAARPIVYSTALLLMLLIVGLNLTAILLRRRLELANRGLSS